MPGARRVKENMGTMSPFESIGGEVVSGLEGRSESPDSTRREPGGQGSGLFYTDGEPGSWNQCDRNAWPFIFRGTRTHDARVSNWFRRRIEGTVLKG